MKTISRFGFPATLLLLFTCGAHAQTKRALLIGIDKYRPANSQSMPPLLTSGHKPDSRFGAGYVAWPDLHGPSNDVEQMRVLLRSLGFTDISVLREPAATQPGQPVATRQGIFDALRQLILRTQPGDIVVFYFAGHGSRRVDTTRPPDPDKGQWDQTIVPADAYTGAYDITDKELAREFNRLLDDKHARLVAIFDSCNSGTQARGITAGATRALAYDDRDVKNDPQAYTGADLKHVPKDGNAIILAAASAIGEAREGWYPSDGQYHGAFTHALVKVLKANPNMRAVDIINSVEFVMRADPLPFQQASVEGRAEESLFGEVVEQRLTATVTAVENGLAHLSLGSLAGFDVNTVFHPINQDSGPTLMINSVDSPTTSTASILPSDAAVSPGETMIVSNMTYPAEAKLRIFVSGKDWNPATAPVSEAKMRFPDFRWAADPSLEPVEYLVIYSAGRWRAIDLNNLGKEVSPGEVKSRAADGKSSRAFLAVPPTKDLMAALEKRAPVVSGGIIFSDQIATSDYLLLGKALGNTLEYTLFRSNALGSRPGGGYVESSISMQSPAAKVVCSQTNSLPTRSEWVPLAREGSSSNDDAAQYIANIGERIAKVRAWMQLLSHRPDVGSQWPYHVELKSNGGAPLAIDKPLPPNTSYEIDLVAGKNDLATHAPRTQYVYVVGVDCAAESMPLYPLPNGNGGAGLPQVNADGSLPDRISLTSVRITTPFGADSIFVLTTPDKITDLSVFQTLAVLPKDQARGLGNGLAELIQGLGDISARGFEEVPQTWTVEHVTVPSSNHQE